MRALLALMALAFNAVDNLTTYLCLRRPIVGFEVYEANPFAAWGFDLVGLETGLILEMGVCAGAILFLLRSRLLDPRVRMTLLALLAVLPAGAVLNNLTVMRELGIPLF